MNMHTKLSGKGQVVVPKAVRDRLGWSSGTDLEVIESADGVFLRPAESRQKLTVEEAVVRLRAIYQHQGPPVSLEEMRRGAQEVVEEHWARSQ
jgi:AbrB family looped-hinge helix DNA binding protein